MLKNFTPKQLLLAACAAVIAVFNFFVPVFHQIGVTIDSIFGSVNSSANGYQYAFGAVKNANAWYVIAAWLHIIVAVAIVALLVYVFVKRPADMVKAGYLAVIASAVLALLYMINGFAMLEEHCYTAAFVPFIIVAILGAGYVVCDKLLGDNLKK